MKGTSNLSVVSRPILGVPIDLPTTATSFSDEELLIIFRGGGHSVAINAEKILANRDSKELSASICGAALSYLDGQPIAFIARLAGYRYADTINLPMRALEIAQRYGLRVGLLGSTEQNVTRAGTNISTRYPKLKLAFCEDGYKRDDGLLASLMGRDADLVLLGIGSPRQEILANLAIERGFQGFIVPCGGAIDILAGAKTRAPVGVQRLGLETPYRLLQEPSRWHRYLTLKDFVLRLPSAFLQAVLGLRSLERF